MQEVELGFGGRIYR